MQDSKSPASSQYLACLIDVGEHFDKDFVQRCGGRIYLSGFFDDATTTYCCSATPMVYVQGLEYVAEVFNEALRDELMECAPESGYYKRAFIDKARRSNPKDFQRLDVSFDDDDNPEDTVREYLQGNPAF